jgi:putative heme iron utilization protein
MPIKKSDAIVHSRQLVRAGRSAALSTILSTNEGWPYTSFVTYATDQSGCLIFLFSDISDHTCNLKTDPRASVLVEQASGRKNPQTGQRVTLIGKIKKTKNIDHANRFLTCHPRAKIYSEFTDFNFYHMRVERAHYIGGFASAVWHKGCEFQTSPKLAQYVKKAEADILAHMNSDHSEAIDLLANKLLCRKGNGWKMVGIDADGIDLIKKDRLARLAFASPLAKASDARTKLVELVSKARS